MSGASGTAESRPELQEFGRHDFSPGAYHVDFATVGAFPLIANGEPSTFADVYYRLRKSNAWEILDQRRYEDAYRIDTGELIVTGPLADGRYVPGSLFVLGVLRQFVELLKDGVDPELASWFYYGHDWSRDADETFFFFLVCNGKIARERFHFIQCDPKVLVKTEPDKEPIWHSEPYEHEAWETYWYRKFYTDTLTGQLMVMRPDEPLLYHYERAAHDVAGDVKLVTIVKTYRLLWVAVPLIAAIAFPTLKAYMAVFAVGATADLLWKIWATRKVGQ